MGFERALRGYYGVLRGTQGVKQYSSGTQGVFQRYSVGTIGILRVLKRHPGVLKGYARALGGYSRSSLGVLKGFWGYSRVLNGCFRESKRNSRGI
jgi:hypothetical protein